MTTDESVGVAAPSGHLGDRPEDDVESNFISRNPIRVAVLSILAVTLAFRWAVVKDGYFITDDFMLTTRALENDFGWDYLTRVHTGHFEPVGFAVMWALSRFAPLNWELTVALLLAAQAAVALLVWRLLCTLFTRRPLALVPFALYCLTPLTVPAFTWLSAAIIWLPLTAAVAGGLRQHVLYARHGRIGNAVGASLWLLFGAASFEKFLVYGPFVAVFTLALFPEVKLNVKSIIGIFRRTWVVWVGYCAVVAVFLTIYLSSSAESDAPSGLQAPSISQLSSFTYLTLLRAFVPVAFGGPWSWTPVSYATGIPDSPQAFDWFFWVLAAVVVLTTLAVRRGIARAWAALLVYLIASMATLAVSRVPIIGSVAGLETRYVADATVPLVVVVGYALMGMAGERRPWLRLQPVFTTPAVRRVRLALSLGLAFTIFGLSLNALNGYAAMQAANPHRKFTETARDSMSKLPRDAQVFDAGTPVDVIGPLFLEYNSTSRFLAPFATTAQRKELYTARNYYTNPYLLTEQGRIVPMSVAGTGSRPVEANGCGYTSAGGRVEVPLEADVFPWRWAIRIGYLSDSDSSATVILGKGATPVRLSKGLGEIVLTVEGGAPSVIIDDLNPLAQVCVGDIQVGQPVPK